jgi:DNA modification methylase
VYDSYQEYLASVAEVMAACHRVLAEGRFLVVNTSPVLVPRTSRSDSSRRFGVPFDLNPLICDLGFEFVDDIVWRKPEGAGWATGRGRRFAADRNPLQYKAVPVTEYLMVYRKATDRLIDWSLQQADPDDLLASRIGDGYERTNVWDIQPAASKLHPAVFPVELAERAIRYWSVRGDLVLDPYAGIGTTGIAAAKLGRRFALVERDREFFGVMAHRAPGWDGVGQVRELRARSFRL